MGNKFNWRDVTAEDEKSLLEKINALSATAWFDAHNSSLETADLCFYANFKLLQATSFSSIPPLTMRYLVGGNAPDWTVVKLDGSNKPIFENNPKAGLILNEKTIILYARFVLDSVLSEDGSMRLTETVDEDVFTRDPTPEQREELTRFVRPAKIIKTEVGFDIDCIILYGDKVYRADVSVLNNGYLEIKNEDLLAENMPIYPIILE